MASFSPSDLAAVAESSLALPAALIKTEDEECRVQPESISTVSQHASLQTMPGPPPSEASEASENTDISPSPHILQPTKADSDRFAEDLPRSFQDASVPSPSTPDIVKTRAEELVAKKDNAHQINYQALIIAISSESSTDMLSSPSSRAPTVSPILDFPTGQSAEDGSKPRDNVMATTPSLSQQSTANSKSPSPSSEEFQVRFLQSKVEEATRAEQTLQEKAGSIWREKQEHDNASAGLNRDLEGIKTDIKGLHAERRRIEAAVRRKKDRHNEITYEKQRIDAKAQAKWEEGNAVKRDVDEAARSRRSLEKELKEAKIQEELFNMYPDAGLRKFAEHALKNEEHSKLFSAFVQGKARDDDLDAIENLLEEAEDGTKNDIKVEAQPLRGERGGTARAESLVKAKSVKIKTEYSTAAPSLHRRNSSSPTAQGLLEAVRQMKACKKNLQAQLYEINSLKRKHQQDNDDSSASRAPTRRVKSVTYQLDTDTGSNSDNDEEQGVDADEMENDG